MNSTLKSSTLCVLISCLLSLLPSCLQHVLPWIRLLLQILTNVLPLNSWPACNDSFKANVFSGLFHSLSVKDCYLRNFPSHYLPLSVFSLSLPSDPCSDAVLGCHLVCRCMVTWRWLGSCTLSVPELCLSHTTLPPKGLQF